MYLHSCFSTYTEHSWIGRYIVNYNFQFYKNRSCSIMGQKGLQEVI